jgi:UDP-N-acetylmuramoyl-tripeptide--D-alanyl-D-alanine ligase
MSAGGAQMLWTSREAIAATSGQCPVDWQAVGVSIDSRSIKTGDLFVALQGPNHDGHDFIESALERDAAAAMVHAKPGTVVSDSPLLVVKDTMTALESLGAASRDRTSAKIIAVTGSVGKTGIKEALKFVLSQQGITHASVGSFNNHWGVPLSLARMAKDTAYGIFEIGMNHPGEITPLSGLVRPHVAIITTVESVHSKLFKSTEEIAQAKAEIFSGVMPGGIAVLNRDNAYFYLLSEAAQSHGVDKIISFGKHERADVRLLNASLSPGHSIAMSEINGRPIPFRIGIPGQHWVMNSLCVLAGVLAAGGNIEQAAFALADMHPPKGRGEIIQMSVAASGGDETLIVIDESYNASPVSMKAALEVLGRHRPTANGRRIAVLGDMLELGTQSVDSHTGLLAAIEENSIDLVFTAGSEMAHLAKALPKSLSGGHAPNSETLAPLVVNAVKPGDIMTVKGSAGSRMSLIIDALGARFHQQREGD